MTTTTAYAWAPITKVEDQPDGTVMVYGPATDTGLDRDGQRMDEAWLDKAMPQWMAEGGNVREQHDPRRAVGVAVGLHKDEGSGAWMLTSHVVDPVAVTKVKAGVLKGYSIGVKDHHVTFGKAEAPNGLIDGGTIVETSLADRPSNPTAYFTIAKADDAGALQLVEDPELVETDPDEADDEEALKAEIADLTGEDLRAALLKYVSAPRRNQMASEGIAMPNGDFPIPDEGHLRSAIGHLGNYDGNRAEAKAHIITRARALGLTNLLPADWGIAKADQVLVGVTQLLANLVKLDGGEAQAALTAAAKALDETEPETTPTGGPDMTATATATATETAPTEAGSAPDLAKVDNTGIADIVKSAVAEATAPLKDELALVKADLAKALEMPVAGGPVGMRTASDTAAARAKDANQLRAQAAEYLTKAADTQDPTLRAGYREKAADLLSKADA